MLPVFFILAIESLFLVQGCLCDCFFKHIIFTFKGYEGANCAVRTNNCAPQPCVNGGTCQNLLNGYTCSCVKGFNGNLCQYDINDCAPLDGSAQSPCLNNGLCTDRTNGYVCSCAQGF